MLQNDAATRASMSPDGNLQYPDPLQFLANRGMGRISKDKNA